MFFSNKWANLGLFVLVALVVSVVVISMTKVVDAKTGEANSNTKLKAFAGGKAETKKAA